MKRGRAEEEKGTDTAAWQGLGYAIHPTEKIQRYILYVNFTCFHDDQGATGGGILSLLQCPSPEKINSGSSS